MRESLPTPRVVVVAFLITAVSHSLGPRVRTSGIRADDTQSAGPAYLSAYQAALPEEDGFVLYETDQGVGCREATVEEALAMARRDRNQELRAISPLRLQADTGLKITLRSTAQLDNFPEAKAAFLRAATTWEALLQTAVTIVIDVDFGPTRFGTAFPPDVLGSTSTQLLLNSNGYGGVRSNLIGGASSPQEQMLYNALPASQVPTDIGDTVAVATPSASLRALGLIPAVADPATEQADFGSPPSVGFNSAFSFDFDPGDGIDPSKTDFDAVAVHEIGHVLGFSSRVGAKELSPDAPVRVSVMDILRFRPGVSLGTFSTSQRVLSSGGDQVFFAGGPQLPVSTGRPDGSGGDGFQASHWRDNTLGGQYIGIMDPAISRGERNLITNNDLAALDSFGYQLKSRPVSSTPFLSAVAGSLSGDVLTLAGAGLDPEGDITQAQVRFQDAAGTTLREESHSVTASVGTPPTFSFVLQVSGLNQLPTASVASVQLSDAAGNRSAAMVADFGQADPGGPNIAKVIFFATDEVVVIKGSGLAGTVQLEVNGAVVAPPASLKAKVSGAKVKVNGNAGALNLRAGANRVRLRTNQLRSNIFVFNL